MSIKKAIKDLEELFRDILWDNIGEDFYKRANNILAEFQQNKSLTEIAIPCGNKDCCGCLEIKEFIDRPVCNECGTVFILVPENKKQPEPSEDNTGIGITLCIPSSKAEGEENTFRAIIKTQKEKIDQQLARIKDLETQNEILKTDLTSQQINKFMNEWEEFMRVCQPDDSAFCKALRIIYQLQNQIKELEKQNADRH